MPHSVPTRRSYDLADLVPLTAAIKAVQGGRIGHQRPANPKRTESARGEWDFLDDISDRYEPANTQHADHRRDKPEIPVYDPLHRLAEFPYQRCLHKETGRAGNDARHDQDVEIGRESCRERVCQKVWISVVAVSLKKKKKK